MSKRSDRSTFYSFSANHLHDNFQFRHHRQTHRYTFLCGTTFKKQNKAKTFERRQTREYNQLPLPPPSPASKKCTTSPPDAQADLGVFKAPLRARQLRGPHQGSVSSLFLRRDLHRRGYKSATSGPADSLVPSVHPSFRLPTSTFSPLFRNHWIFGCCFFFKSFLFVMSLFFKTSLF